MGIIVALSVTRYLFHVTLLIWYLLNHMNKLVPKIDFGYPNWSDFKLMFKINMKIWSMTFLKYFHNLLNSTNEKDTILNSNISRFMIGLGVILIILGLAMQFSWWNNPHFEIMLT